MAVYDNGVLAAEQPPSVNTTTWQPVQFSVSRNQNAPLLITSPTDNQLIHLDQQNYTATAALPFNATLSSGGSINWTTALSYNTSQGYGYFTDNSLSFSTTSGNPPSPSVSYQSEGGRVKATATAADGSGAQDCVTFYVDGEDGSAIDPGSITSRLDTIYPASYSYGKSLNDGTATPNLMTGVAWVESQYRQFGSFQDTPPVQNPDLYNLFALYGIVAQWPEESHEDGGSHIGLMMVPSTNAGWEWNWQSNTSEGVTVFSGGSPTVDDKIQDAVRFEGYLVSGDKTLGFPAHIGLPNLTGMQRENNGLVLYRGVGLGPTTADTLNELYYIATCPSPGTWTTTNKGLKCTVGKWYWAGNSGGQPTGVSYADSVRQNLR